MGKDKLDVRGIIEGSSRQTTVSALQRRGINRVRLIDERQIHGMITQAVQRIVVDKAHLMTEREREKVYRAARRELGRLIQEQTEIQAHSARAIKDQVALEQELGNLRQQLKLTRDVAEADARKKVNDLISAQSTQIKDLMSRVTALKGNLEEARAQRASGQQNLNDEISKRLDALDRRIGDNKKPTDDMDILRKSLGGIARKIDSIKVKVSGEDVTYRPGELTLGKLINEEVENNMDSIGIKNQAGSSVDDALKRLRGLRKKSG